MKFSELNLHPQIRKNLEKIDFVECTPIQAEAIPKILAGKDVAGLAQTGTGKTAAFLLPIINRILQAMEKQALGERPASEADQTEGDKLVANSAEAFKDWKKRHFILILVPTRELAEQVYDNAKKFLEGTGLKAVSIYGGTSYDRQKAGLKEGVEFVIATPGRLIDLYKEHLLDLKQCRAVIFDEADRMFDMGFKDDMRYLLSRIPRERQFLVFSATLNFDVLNVAYEFGADPVELNVSREQTKAENVQDEIFHVGQEDKPKFLLSLLRKHKPQQVIIFSNFKHNVERIAQFLTKNSIPAVGISSLLTQAQRNRVMSQFKAENDRNILVATDVAARGLDILGVDLVINFDLPDDPENYVHRIGRTGRAGHKGLAFSMVSDRDVEALMRIEEYVGHKLAIGWLDDKDLATDFAPFPSDKESFSKTRERTPREHRSYNEERQGRGASRGRGPDRGQRGPKAAQGGEERRRQRYTKKRNEPRRDEARNHQREEQPRHRDRRMGRHSNAPQGLSQKPSSMNQRKERSPYQRDKRRSAGGVRPHRPNTAPAAMVAKSGGSWGQKITGFIKNLFK